MRLPLQDGSTARRPVAAACLLSCLLALAACAERAAPPAAPAAAAAPEPDRAAARPSAPDAVDRSAAPVPGPIPPPVDPPPAPAEDLPTLTTATSRADATHTLPDVPILRAVRTGVQPGADRLVFEFDGDGLPAWQVDYVDRPQYECGSGEAVRLRGDAWLQIRFTGAQAHTEAGEGTSGPRRRTLDMDNLLELARICDFEGEVTWVAAVKRPEGYTPRVLAGPARLVIDIAH